MLEPSSSTLLCSGYAIGTSPRILNQRSLGNKLPANLGRIAHHNSVFRSYLLHTQRCGLLEWIQAQGGLHCR